MPWTDQNKSGREPGPWDAPEAAKPDAAPSPDAPRGAASPSDRAASPAKRRPSHRLGALPPREARASQPSKPATLGPNLDELTSQLHIRWRRVVFGNGETVRPVILVAAVLVAVAAWLASGLYEVGLDQVGLVSRFGVYAGEDGPGLRFHLPAPIETVRTVSLAPDHLQVGSLGGEDEMGSLPVVTRDGDPFTLGFALGWRVVDPVRYAFGGTHSVRLSALAQAAVRSAVSEAGTAELLAGDRRISAKALAGLQAALDRSAAGVRATDLRLEGVTPPADAREGLSSVRAAQAEAAAGLREAGAYRTRVLADAHADAAKTIRAAETVRDQEVSEAKGEAVRFALVDAQYRKAPAITRERLYTETMARVLHGLNKVIIPPSKTGGQVVLPAEAFRRASPDSKPSGPVSSGAGDGR
jgi:modulator of FtsH protease HflK